MPALIIALVIALTTATGGGIVLASEGALPGDALYGVKQVVEGVPLAFANSDEAKAQLYLEQAAERVAEAREASERGRPESAAAAAAGFSERVAQANEHLERAEASGKDVDELVALLQSNLDRQQEALGAAMELVPEEAKPALEHAMLMAQKGLMRAMESVRTSEAGLAEPDGRPEDKGRPEGAGKPEWVPGATGPSEKAAAPDEVAAANRERASALAAAARAGDVVGVRMLADQLLYGVEAEIAAQERADADDAASRHQAADQLSANLGRLQTQLEEIAEQVPAEAQPAMDRVRAATAQGLAKAQQMMEAAPVGDTAPADVGTPVTPSSSPADRGPQVSPPAPAGEVPSVVGTMVPEVPGRPELPVIPPAPAGRP